MKNEERTLISTKTYTVTVESYSDGTHSMKRLNDGFNAYELLGVSYFIGHEVRDQIIGKIKPDIITRQTVSQNEDASNSSS